MDLVILPSIASPDDLRGLSYAELNQLSAEIRTLIIDTVTSTGGHLGSNLGVVELTIALHRDPRPAPAKRSLFTWGRHILAATVTAVRTPAQCWSLPDWQTPTWQAFCQLHLT